MALYARCGIQEYWIVTPFPSLVEVYALDGASYRVHQTYKKDEVLHSAQFADLTVDLSDVFDFPLESEEEQIEETREPPGG